MILSNCPRCGVQSVEHLRSHAYCMECNFFEGDNSALNEWHRLEYRQPRMSKGHLHNPILREKIHNGEAAS